MVIFPFVYVKFVPETEVTTPVTILPVVTFAIPKLPVVYVNPTPVIDVTTPTLI